MRPRSCSDCAVQLRHFIDPAHTLRRYRVTARLFASPPMTIGARALWELAQSVADKNRLRSGAASPAIVRLFVPQRATRHARVQSLPPDDASRSYYPVALTLSHCARNPGACRGSDHRHQHNLPTHTFGHPDRYRKRSPDRQVIRRDRKCTITITDALHYHSLADAFKTSPAPSVIYKRKSETCWRFRYPLYCFLSLSLL